MEIPREPRVVHSNKRSKIESSLPVPIPKAPTSEPVFIPDPTGRTDIKLANKGFFREREASNIPKHLTLTLPKGTLLFRGIYADVMNAKYDDVMGIGSRDNIHKRCITPNFQVYFYPYPYVVATISDISGLDTMMVYVTTQDIEIVCLVNPSQYTRESTDTNIIQRCKDIQPYGCGLQGKAGDSCLTRDYMTAFPDVTGMLAIAATDAREQEGILSETNQSFSTYRRYAGIQYGMITDARNEKEGWSKVPNAVPEIVLTPFNRALKEPYVDEYDISYDAFVSKFSDVLNYREFATLSRADGDESEVEEFMNQILSKDGYNGYHVAIDRQTGFYRVKELSDPFDSTGAMVRWNEPEFVFKRTPDFIAKYGRSRRKTRRGKKSVKRRF
jgi:hypothetical protein